MSHGPTQTILEYTEQVQRMARMYANAWNNASKTNAEIVNAIIDRLITEGMTRDSAWRVADDAIRYMQRYF